MAIEFRGCKNLVFAQVLQDDAEGYVTGEVIPLAPVAEISKSVETSSEAHYYDNKAAIVINSEGADTVSFTIAVPDDDVLAMIEGRVYDSTKKMFIEAPRKNDYFAVGYILGETGEESGNDERFVWRYKGTFNIPDVTASTENDSTDANNMSLEFTGIYTNHEFANGGGTGVTAPAKSIFIRKSSNVATEEQFFAQVTTPDTEFTPAPVTSYTLSITEAENTTVSVTRGGTALANGASLALDDELVISVTGGTITVNGEAFTSGNTYTVAGNVAVVSTAAQG